MSDDGMTVHEVEQDGFTLRVRYDEFADAADSPRQWCNIGTMVCWHPDYYLGDFQVTNPEGRGAVDNAFHRDDFRNLNVLARYLTLAERAIIVLPLYLYDHSGISMSVRRNPFDSGGWDTTMVGFVYTTQARVEELCGNGWEGDVADALVEEVKTYDAYLRGEVYCYLLTDPDGDVIESCHGYVGDSDAALADGKAELDHAVAAAKERSAKAWAQAHGGGK